MEWRCGRVNADKIILQWLFSGMLIFIASAAAHGASLCIDCHGMPPIDAAYRNVSTGGLQGNHQTHQPATAAPANCEPCHTGSSTYVTGHQNGVITIAANINNSPVAATYSKGVFFNQTSVPVLGTCSSVNCHFERVTPIWGSTPLTVPSGCSTCHDNPPGDGNHPSIVGAGKKHGDYYGTGTTSCVKCHSTDYTAVGKPFAHATSAAHRSIALQFTVAPNSGGTYSKTTDLAYPNYLPSQTSAANRNGTCSSMYCHSDGNGGAPNTTPAWGSTLPADCSGCHGGNATAAQVLVTGSHGQHINNAALLGANFNCAACHVTTTAAGDDRTITDITTHVKGSKTVAFSSGGTYVAGSKTCAATSCHSAGKSAAPQPAAPAWGGAPLGCNGCHGAGNALGMPDYANAGAAAALANSHPRHVLAAADCDKCHANTTTTGVAIKAGSVLHTNGAIDITFNTVKAGAGATWAAATKSCSATYCHSGSTPVWGGVLPADCTGCHGNDASSAAAISSGKHTAHVNNQAILGAGNNLGCVDCHAKTVSANRTIANSANHVNGFLDYSGTKAGGSARYSTATKQCSTLYCHSNGNPAALAYANPPAWNSTSTLNCNGCHGLTNAATGAPDYANGGAGTVTANSHVKHVSGAGITDTKGCANCHSKTVDAAIAGKLRNYSSLHLNKQVDINFSAAIGGSYNSAAATCAATYCHGTAASPAWGAATLACNSCHGANSSLPGAHSRHWESATSATSYTAPPANSGSAAQYQFACTSCHAAPATHANGAASINGAAQVFFGYSSATLKGNYSFGSTQGADNGFKWTNGSCAATYCHSNGNGSAGNTATFTWATAAGSIGCAGCHGGDAASTAPITTGKHAAHINNAATLGTNFGCTDCHAKTVSNNTTISNKLNHVNKFKDYSGLRAGGSSKYNVTAKTCATIYCHSNGRGVYASPPAWNSPATMGCNGCHGTTNAFGIPDYANGGAASATANNHAKHVTSAADCDKCHTLTSAAGTAINAGSIMHINGVIDVNFNAAKAGAAASWNGTTMTCSATSCHGTKSPVWGATLSADCTGCHGGTASSSSPMATNAHGKHLTTAYGPGAYLGNSLASCQTCHNYNSTQPDPNHVNGVVDVINGTGSACAGCHPGGLPAWTVGTRLACTVCHAATPSVLPNGVAAPFKANFATTGHGQFSASNQCTACHDPNSTHITGALGDSARLTLANDNTQCASCHNNTTARSFSTHVLDKSATPTASLCSSCHDVHGTSNLHMIKTTINGTAVTFTNMSSGFVKLTAPYNGLCQVCHTLTNHYRSGAAPVDGHPTKNCLSCHDHKAAFAFQPSSSCDSCHGYPPAPAGFAGSQGNYSSARVENYLGGSGAHMVAAHIKKTAKPSEGWANCAKCHSNGTINPATHTMVLPVTPSKITVDVDNHYKFNASLPLGPTQYNGLLVDGGANITGSCSNVSCHIKPSKKWSTVK